MRVAVIGGGFTGLTSALELLKKGYEVTVFESLPDWGGLASAFEILPGIKLERFYHHLFTNDYEILNLCRELGIYDRLLFLSGKTSILYGDKIYPFDTPLSVLRFSPLSVRERLRLGIVTLFLRLVHNNHYFEGTCAINWLSKWYGNRIYKMIWEPLLIGKFNGYYGDIIMSWFWARIKKRTSKLIYPRGGFQTIIDSLVGRVSSLGGILKNSSTINKIELLSDGGFKLSSHDDTGIFDKLIVTSSLRSLLKLFPQLPDDYRKMAEKVKYLNAQVLILVLDKPLMDYYWLNVNDTAFPFLIVGEQSNLLGRAYYQNKSIVYLGNYLPDGDRRLLMDAPELLNLYQTHIKKISPNFEIGAVKKAVSFIGPFAQPIVNIGYKENIPPFETPINNLYLATMAQVYPWDRGTNFAVKLGRDLVREYF